jgi:hypothetical protein
MIPTTPAVVKAPATEYHTNNNSCNNNSHNSNKFMNMFGLQMSWSSAEISSKPHMIPSSSGNKSDSLRITEKAA